LIIKLGAGRWGTLVGYHRGGGADAGLLPERAEANGAARVSNGTFVGGPRERGAAAGLVEAGGLGMLIQQRWKCARIRPGAHGRGERAPRRGAPDFAGAGLDNEGGQRGRKNTSTG